MAENSSLALLLTDLLYVEEILPDALRARVLRASAVGDVDPEVLARVVVVALRSGAELGDRQLRCLPRLRAVVRPGSGLDNIAVESLQAAGVELHRLPGVSAEAVSELVEMGLTALCRRVPEAHSALLRGIHMKNEIVGDQVSDLDVCIWGAGPLGREVHARLCRLGARTFMADYPSVPRHIARLSAEEAMAKCDAHIIALPLRATTRQLFDQEWFETVKSKAPYVINVGRWETVDFDAALASLRQGRLRGLYSDAIDRAHVTLVNRCDQERPLNLLLTPHLGAQRQDTRRGADKWAVAMVRSVLEGG